MRTRSLLAAFLALSVPFSGGGASAALRTHLDPAAASLAPGDLGEGWTMQPEERLERGGVIYSLTVFDLEPARAGPSTGLVGIRQQIQAADPGFAPGVAERLAQVLVEAVGRESGGEPPSISGPPIGVETVWMRRPITLAGRQGQVHVVAFRLGAAAAGLAGVALPGQPGMAALARLAEIVKSRMAVLQGVDWPATVVRDDFDDPSEGILLRTSNNPFFDFGYVDGEYFVRRVGPSLGTTGTITNIPIGGQFGIPSEFADTTLAIDGRLIGELGGRTIGLSCRDTVASQVRTPGYRLTLDPVDGSFLLIKSVPVDIPGLETTGDLRLAEGIALESLGEDGTNRLELTCASTTISVAINGVEVASIEDGAHSQGRMSLWFATRGDEGEVRFDNLEVVERLSPP